MGAMKSATSRGALRSRKTAIAAAVNAPAAAKPVVGPLAAPPQGVVTSDLNSAALRVPNEVLAGVARDEDVRPVAWCTACSVTCTREAHIRSTGCLSDAGLQ